MKPITSIFSQRLLTALSLFLLLIAPVTLAAPAEIKQHPNLRVEPEFWWADMVNPKLQLMLHGLNISELTPMMLDNPANKDSDITIIKVEKTNNPNYLFITLDLTHAKPHTFDLMLTSAGNSIHSFSYSLLERGADSAIRQGFSNKDVIYLITPDRFSNGDTDNDNQASMSERVNRQAVNGRHGGDIQGIENSLDYLADLGVTQLWINPLLENNQAKYSYHGYSTTDHYRIDPRFGNNEEYRQLAASAKEKGIGIIKDIVVNHIGSEHWWMKDLPSTSWINGKKLVQDSPSLKFTSHRRTTVQDPYAVDSDRGNFVHGWFVDSMPDLNQQDPLLATYLIQNSIWWVEYAGLSGIREDTYSYADKSFLSLWSKAIMNEYPNFNIVGEEWSNNPITVSYWQAGKLNQDGYASNLPSLMDFPLYEVMLEAFNQDESWDTGLISLYEMLANDVVYAYPTNLVLFEGNHDTNRLYSLMNEDLGLFKMVITYVLTSNRIPQLFYGTEVLMTSPKEGRHDGAVRGEFPGGWTNDKVSAITGGGLSQKQKSAQDFIKALLNFRKSSSAIHSGKLRHYVPIDGIYVYFRFNHDEAVMVIINKNNKPVSLATRRFNAQLDGFTQGVNVLTKSTVELNTSAQSSLQIPAHDVLVLSMKH
ncbi:glycosidase [Shewanella psychrophila]|uniref:Glycosidase n=1 Tax=Shewanella psychrophila TaxID=225848 RepID=A0A1S6HK39_9GAMM|nr:glycoside hydrolase family 13 protein [Shewanella psychrophila]AQS35905.1 glycosidase [Shewanella psychrophila]